MNFSGEPPRNQSDRENLRNCAAEIEATLESFGFTIRVVEVNTLRAFYDYYLEIAMGTDLNKLEKHDRELALALESPTGKVYWQIPVPGKSFIGLRVPRPSSKIKHEELMRLNIKDWRSKLASAFYSMGEACFAFARKILGY
jgi:DNA segregation ATPase FtsK/SpoIIIE-like protein